MEIDKDRVAIVFDNDMQITTDGTVASISDSLRKKYVVPKRRALPR